MRYRAAARRLRNTAIGCDEVRTGYPLEQDQRFTGKDVRIEVYITITDQEIVKLCEN
jgi:hypothetical protein